MKLKWEHPVKTQAAKGYEAHNSPNLNEEMIY